MTSVQQPNLNFSEPNTLDEIWKELPSSMMLSKYEVSNKIRDLLSSIGYSEIMTYSFVSKKELEAVDVP